METEAPGKKTNPKVIGAEFDFQSSGHGIMCPACGTHFQSFSPSLAVTCPSCKATGFQFPDNIPTCPGCGKRGPCFIVDDVHWKLWVPFPPEVMQKFLEQQAAGNSERTVGHCNALSKWLSAKPRTIRHMTRDERASLRKEIIDALIAHGTTRQRAEQLTASVRTVEDRLQPVAGRATAIGVTKTSATTTVRTSEPLMPYLDNNGRLIIPVNCPPKYRWWQGGQSIAETLAELTPIQLWANG